MKDKVITALDIGTTKICCLISIIDKNGKIKICGMGESTSDGLCKGMIKNIRPASISIDKAISEAEKIAKLDAQNIYVGVGGQLIKSFVRHGIANITSKSKYTEEVNENEVTEKEIEQVKMDAKENASITQDCEIIHIEPQFYKVDGMNNIIDPIGMTGHRLEAYVHIVTANLGYINSIYRSIQMLGLNVEDVVLQPIASSIAVLNDDERELGAILVDIGGGTTDISIYYRNSIRFSSIIPFGGEDITYDLAVGLRTPKSEAEKIKLQYGYAVPEYVDKNEKITVPGIGGHPPTKRSKKFIAEIINSRVKEIVKLVFKEVERSKYLKLSTAGISVCGGAANLKKTNELFSKVFGGLPTKTGYPTFDEIYGNTETLSNPKYATVVGLLKWGKNNYGNSPFSPIGKESIISRIARRIKNWFKSKNFT